MRKLSEYKYTLLTALVASVASLLTLQGLRYERDVASLQGCMRFERIVAREATVNVRGVFVNGRQVSRARVGTCYRFTPK